MTPAKRRSGQTPDKTFAPLWPSFIGAARQDLDRLPKDRPIDQYLQWKEAVLEQTSTPEFSQEIEIALAQLWADPTTRAAAQLLEGELQAYAAAVKVAQLQRRSEPDLTEPPSMTSLGKTAVDSFKEIASNLPPGVRALLTLLSEVFEIFK
jgi:hypothetical protein